jgi:hypothetical protein
MSRKFGRVMMLALVGGCTAAILYPAHSRAYALLGGSLRLGQRDVRVFDNFTNPEAHDNTTPDPNFPGASGATLAIWKGCIEWGSELHGDGNGDPTQPGGLGSGGANFDPSWQGAATSPGRTNDNIISALAGSNFGILAFTEKPIEDGWRIRFYQAAAVWEDGPDNYPNVTGHYDIQGVATHEYGHALGLDHSGVATATMAPSHPDNWIPSRSIEADDIAGIQAVYGPRSPGKPHITTYTLSNHVLTISGANFSPAENEVWFTNGSPASDGTPLEIGHLRARDGGTRIVLELPILAAAGDVLVKGAGSGDASLSNAYPFDPSGSPCPTPELYGTAKLTSQGTSPTLFTTGSPHLVTGDFNIGTLGGFPDALCVLFHGSAAGATPWMGGMLYVAGPLQREPRAQFDFVGGVLVPIPIDASMIGTTRYYQLWFQDPGDPFGVGISNAVAVTFCP